MDIINPYIHGGEALTFDGFGNRSRSFDGVDDYIDLGDSDDFSFGDGSNDSPFSISAWIKPNAGSFRILTKYNNDTNTREYTFTIDSSNRLIALLYDQSNSNTIVRRCSSNLMSNYFGQWVHVVMTYDGSSTHAGLKCFINKVREDDLSTGFGSYVSMENTNESAKIGVNGSTAYSNGKKADVRLYNSELSTTDILNLYNGTNITTNLVGHWLTDADNLLDAAGTNHGTNYGSKYSYDNPSPPVEFGSASRLFDGVSDIVDLGNIHNDTVFTVSAWIKRDRIDGTYSEGVVGKWATTNDDDKHWLLYSTPVSHTFIINQTNNTKIICAGPASISSNQWYHLAATLDGTNIKLYVDGSLVDTQTYDGTIKINATNTKIGVFSDSNNNFFEGKIADVRYYDTDLTASQISDIYAGTDVQTNLAGHWLTDNDDVEDKAGTNDGTNFGSTYSYDNPPMDLVPSRQASRDFDGVSDYVDLGNIFSGDTVFSVSSWIKKETTDASFGKGVISKFDSGGGGMSWVLFTGETDVRFLIRQTNNTNIICISTTDASVGEWFHLSATVDGSEIKIYINGNLQDTTAFDGTITTSTASVVIGAYNALTSANFFQDGKIADVRYYDTDLTASQILDIYNGTTDRTNLIGQWLTNSDEVLDHAGTNDGTNFGSTYSTDSPS